MKAVVFDNGLKLDNNYPMPVPQKGEALIKVNTIGICNTDYEITLGYMGYKGILGHEFTGVVEKAENKDLIGKRVVGEINCGCGQCDWCAPGVRKTLLQPLNTGYLAKRRLFCRICLPA